MTRKGKNMGMEVALLESRLILRNRAARYLVVAGPLMATLLAILMLNYPGPSGVVAEIMYLSCMFTPITYGSLAFSWNATNWASLFQLPVAPKDHIVGRLQVSILLTVPPAVVLTAFTAWLRPELAGLPGSAALFGITVASVPFFLVSARTPKRLDANAPPLADTKKFGWQHWLAGLVIVAPGIVLARLISIEQFIVALGVIGALALAALAVIVRYGSLVLAKSIPDLSDRLLDG